MGVRVFSTDHQATSWREQWLRNLNAMPDADAAFRSLHAFVTPLGFEYYAYTLRTSVPITRSHAVSWSNYPEAWLATYAARGYAECDPVLQFCQRSVSPLLWPQADKVGESDASYWADARACGLRHGWSQTVRDHRGIFGTFSLARSTERITEDALVVVEPEMIWLAQLVHATISNLVVAQLLPDAAAPLKDVERRTLHWTAEGKTVAEVAAILEMTERNVSFHIQNAVAKLNAANKTHAVVKAALLGLIPAIG